MLDTCFMDGTYETAVNERALAGTSSKRRFCRSARLEAGTAGAERTDSCAWVGACQPRRRTQASTRAIKRQFTQSFVHEPNHRTRPQDACRTPSVLAAQCCLTSALLQQATSGRVERCRRPLLHTC